MSRFDMYQNYLKRMYYGVAFYRPECNEPIYCMILNREKYMYTLCPKNSLSLGSSGNLNKLEI